MALIIDSNIKDIVGASGASIAKEIIGGISGSSFWRAEYFAFKDGVLADGVSYQNFTNTDGYLYACADVGADESMTTSTLLRFDMTDYNYVDITLDYQTNAFFGDAYIGYGLNSYTPNNLSSESKVNTTITLDVSPYSGVNSINFNLHAASDSDTYGATSSIWIKEIKLYN